MIWVQITFFSFFENINNQCRWVIIFQCLSSEFPKCRVASSSIILQVLWHLKIVVDRLNPLFSSMLFSGYAVCLLVCFSLNKHLILQYVVVGLNMPFHIDVAWLPFSSSRKLLIDWAICLAISIKPLPQHFSPHGVSTVFLTDCHVFLVPRGCKCGRTRDLRSNLASLIMQAEDNRTVRKQRKMLYWN